MGLAKVRLSSDFSLRPRVHTDLFVLYLLRARADFALMEGQKVTINQKNEKYEVHVDSSEQGPEEDACVLVRVYLLPDHLEVIGTRFCPKKDEPIKIVA